MENLAGTILSDTVVRFEGMTEGHDVAPIVIEVTLNGPEVLLSGSIVPGCCDRFSYFLNGFAVQIEVPYCVEKPQMDFTNDCKVDIADLAEFAESWLECNLIPQWACW